MSTPPPLRFLGAVVGGWACLRVVMLAPGWSEDAEHPIMVGPMASPSSAIAAHSKAGSAALAQLRNELVPICRSCRAELANVAPVSVMTDRGTDRAAGLKQSAHSEQNLAPSDAASPGVGRFGITPAFHSRDKQLPASPEGTPAPLSIKSLLAPASVARWSASAWALIREGRSSPLAPAGTLGGSQLGARFSYRLNQDAARPLVLSAQLYSPVNNRKAAEAALGLEWKPLDKVPVRVLAERREALGREGRSAFSLLAHGGVSDFKLAGPLLVNGYAQVGMVGLKSRDFFADGSATIGVAVDERRTIAVGAGGWGAVQPGASRLDFGPTVSMRVPLQGHSIRLSADWRFRIAGEASPHSGPALTVGTDF